MAKMALSLFLLLLVLASGGGTATPDVQADIAAVKKVREQAVAAQNAGDFEAFSALMADDIIFMPPNLPAAIGKEGLRALWAVRWAPFRYEVTLHHDEVIVAGDWAIHRGRIIGRRIPKAGGEPEEVKRKAIDILRRQPDGSWMHARISTNDDLPSPCSTPR